MQKQSHDTVLREDERERGAFASACFYILQNPVREELVAQARDWKWSGAVLPGFPDVHPLEEDFWPLFWKLYHEHREPGNSPKLPHFDSCSGTSSERRKLSGSQIRSLAGGGR